MVAAGQGDSRGSAPAPRQGHDFPAPSGFVSGQTPAVTPDLIRGPAALGAEQASKSIASIFLPAAPPGRKSRIARDVALLILAGIAVAAATRSYAQTAPSAGTLPELVIRAPECPTDESGCLKLSVDTNLVIGTSGAVKSCVIAKSNAPKPLEDKVCEISERRLKFKPRIVDGAPVEFDHLQRVSFHLKELPPSAAQASPPAVSN